jgi:DNA-binding beta-propeller fold protein YncE
MRGEQRCAGRHPREGFTVRARTLLALLGVLLGACALVLAPTALGASEFASEGEGAGELGLQPEGIAINQGSGDVYIADTQNNRVEQFSGVGSFIRTWGFGVSDGVSEAFQICEAAPCFGGRGGGGGGQFSEPLGIAVDNSAGLSHGDVYVEDRFNHRVDRFGPEGQFILAFGGEVNKNKSNVCEGEECQAGKAGSGSGQFGALQHDAIAVGPTGTVYVGDTERVQEFSAGGALEGTIALPAGSGAVEALAVDSSGDIYVFSSELHGIRKYDGTGAELGEARDPGAEGLAIAITVDASDRLLVADPERTSHLFIYDAAGTKRASLFIGADVRGGIALNDSTQALYVLHQAPSRVRIQTLPPPGPVILEESESASEVSATSATLNAKVNPEGPEETSCHFEYGPSEAYGSQTPEEALVPGSEEPGFEDQPVSAPLSGLQPSTTYHFRVVCENVLKQKTLGPDQTFTTLPPVSIDSESSTKVTASSAKLLAELNPHGLATEYHFEYGTTAAYGQSAPIPEGEAGEGTSDVSLGITIQGLQPNTTYHYRVVAHNALGTTQGADETFTTQGIESPTLPDGRGYEMVSPPAKHGVSLEGQTDEGGVIEAAKEGGGLAYIATGPIDEDPEGNHSGTYSQLLAKREGAGVWSTEDIATAHDAPKGFLPGHTSEYILFSSDLARGAVEPFGATPLSPLASNATPYIREADGTYTPLVYPGDVPVGTAFGEGNANPVEFVTGTADMRHALLKTAASLVQGFDNKGKPAIYEWSEGTISPVSILPSGAPSGEEGEANAGVESGQVRGAISEDGDRVFFEVSGSSHLYMREMTLKQTLRIDTAAPGVKEPAGSSSAIFQLASSDGSRVLFTDPGKLTKDATARENRDLYECKVVMEAGKAACELSDLSVDEHQGQSADVQGVTIGASEDGRYVYFAAKGSLAPGAPSGGACPQAGEGPCTNIYAADTQSGKKALVAVLAEGDLHDWTARETETNLGNLTARVSPDGRYLAFMSERPLTGYDNRDAQSGARDEEVFIYHAPEGLEGKAGTLTCASCDSTGQRPEGVFDEGVFPGLLVDRPRVWEKRWLAASLPGWTRVDKDHALHQPRYLSNSGRLFFDTPGNLVPADQNATQDVYQYEPKGTGNCGEPTGCVSLISPGSSSEESALLDASESGDDVFFLTAAQIAKADTDKAFDVYDAHVCADAPGCPGPEVGTPPPCSSTDACRAAPAPQPDIFGAPASSSFHGAGNLTPPAAVKAKAKPLTRAQKLAKALKACRKLHKPARRSRCIKHARARYGSKKGSRAKKSSKSRNTGTEGGNS